MTPPSACVSTICGRRFWPSVLPGLPNVDFNLSHSGDLVVCAMSTGSRVGIDVEAVRDVELSGFGERIRRVHMGRGNAGSCPPQSVLPQLDPARKCCKSRRLRHCRTGSRDRVRRKQSTFSGQDMVPEGTGIRRGICVPYSPGIRLHSSAGLRSGKRSCLSAEREISSRSRSHSRDDSLLAGAARSRGRTAEREPRQLVADKLAGALVVAGTLSGSCGRNALIHGCQKEYRRQRV